MIRTLIAFSVFTVTLFAQRSVPPEFMYHRVYAVLPLVGNGTPGDPKRPMLVPGPSQPGQIQSQTSQLPELLGWQMQVSDDGKFALVELVFQNPVAFHNFLAKAAMAPGLGLRMPALQPISGDGSNLRALAGNTAALKNAFESFVPGLKLFERGKASEAQILAQFRAVKANFTFSGSVRPR